MPTVVRIRGWGFALVNLPLVLVYGYGRGSCHSVISNHCIRRRLLVFKFSNVRVGVAEYYLQNFVGMLVSRIGGGSGGWASVPLWCILLLAGVVGYVIFLKTIKSTLGL